MSQHKPKEIIFQHSVSGVISYVVFSFCRLAISGTSFLVVLDYFEICKICCFFTYHGDLH